MRRYLVMVPEFRWNGRTHKVGDSIEAENTTEILTNVALGRLTPHAGAIAEPQPPVKPQPPRPATAEPAPPPRAAPMTTEDMPQTGRRRYMRRDLQSE